MSRKSTVCYLAHVIKNLKASNKSFACSKVRGRKKGCFKWMSSCSCTLAATHCDYWTGGRAAELLLQLSRAAFFLRPVFLSRIYGVRQTFASKLNYSCTGEMYWFKFALIVDTLDKTSVVRNNLEKFHRLHKLTIINICNYSVITNKTPLLKHRSRN